MSCPHADQQAVKTYGGKTVANICTTCLTVLCKDCKLRVFWPDSDALAKELENDEGLRLFCRCRPYTKRFANRKPKKADAR